MADPEATSQAETRDLLQRLQAPLPEQARRISGRSGDASDATEAVLHRLATMHPGVLTWHRAAADDTALHRCRTLLAQAASTAS